MKITYPTFYRLALLLPYLVGVILFFMSSIPDLIPSPGLGTPSWLIKTLFMISLPITLVGIVFLVGASYWLIPYTIIVILLLLWSRGKSRTQIFKVYIWSPFYLAILIPVFVVTVIWLNFDPKLIFVVEDIGSITLFSFILGIPIGYVFISITAWIDGILYSNGWIIDKDSALGVQIS